VRYRGVDALESRAGGSPASRAPEQLSQEQLGAWQRGLGEFRRGSYVGSLLLVLGFCGLPAALLVAMISPMDGATVALLSLAALAYGAVRNHRLAQRHLRCPQCGHHPVRTSATTISTPALALGPASPYNKCIHCGTFLPLDPEFKEE
jgi:hypothetical protein